ncbi:MAG: hypothetical protein ACHRHE_14045 [Tepidisphaerales bacterium]
MRLKGLWRACLLAFALAFSPYAAAQQQQKPSAEERLERLEQRMEEMEKRHQAELKARDEEIARLKAGMQAQPATAPAAKSDIDRSRDSLLAELDETNKTTDKVREAVLKDARERTDAATKRTPVSFNPDIAVVTNFVGSLARTKNNDALNRMDVGEVEMDMRAAVDPRADAVVILSFARDIANPVFPTGEKQSGPDTSVDIEEGYLFLHDFGVPNLTAKLGRFHLRFGRQNVIHAHDLPTSDTPLVNQAFLAPEALSDAGLSLSYVVPNPWNQYFELVAEVISGEGANSQSPTLSGDASVASPAANFHALWNHDIGKDWNLELGASWLTGHTSSDIHRRTDLLGADFTLLHTDPTGRFNNQVFQGEFIYGLVDKVDRETENSWGAYLLAQQQLNRDWYVGCRLDYTQNPFNNDQATYGVAPYVSWYWSEFLRFRMQYEHRGGDVPSEEILFFQATWIIGAHPPHPYWSMR